MNDFYVYVLFDHFGIPRYIGKGRGDRWHHHEVRKSKNYPKNAFVRETMQSLGEVPKVKLRESLSEQEAFDTEVALIAAIGRIQIGTGPLTNLTNGGEGMVGYKFSPEQRAAMGRSISAAHLKHDPKVRSDRARNRELSRSIEARKSSSAKRLATMTAEQRSSCAVQGGLSFAGTRWITDGTTSRRIPSTATLPKGWNYGRRLSMADSITIQGSIAPSPTTTSDPALPSETRAT